MNELIKGDCLEVMARIPDKSIDMILTDLPYGTISCSWDNIIPFDELWKEYERIITDKGSIVLTASGQFTHKAITSNLPLYKYKWIWVKTRKGNFINAKNRPMTQFEEVLVFSKGNTANGSKIKMNYFPQGLEVCNEIHKDGKNKFGSMVGKRASHKKETLVEVTGYPTDVLYFDSEGDIKHPTQKPVPLFEYLIKTYTNEGDLVLDNCAGSGTTGIACINTNRNYILIEKDETYFELLKKRIEIRKQELF